MVDTNEMVELRNKVQELYRGLCCDIYPRYPRCLIWIVPKEGHIRNEKGEVVLWTPDAQNKTVYEGMVLRTYTPFWRTFRARPKVSEESPLKDQEVVQEVCVTSGLSPGDHVLFAHFEGLEKGLVPHLGGGYGEYRLIREEALIATLDYKGVSNHPKKKLSRLLGTLIDEFDRLPKSVEGNHQAGELIEKFVAKLMDNADVLFHPESKTISGK